MAAWRNEISLLVLKKYFTRSLRSLVKYFSTLEEKFRICARPCNILYIQWIVQSLVSPILIHWIVIYPVDSASQRLNNWNQIFMRHYIFTCVSKSQVYLFMNNEHRNLGSIFAWIKHLHGLITTGVKSTHFNFAENLSFPKTWLFSATAWQRVSFFTLEGLS